MRCPVCLDTELSPHIRSGIEVDHCPRCRGMWLDRGELEKLLDLAEARSPEPGVAPRQTAATAPSERPWDAERHHSRQYDERDRDRYRDDRDRDRDRDRRDDRDRPRRKRKGALSDLLEEVFDVL